MSEPAEWKALIRRQERSRHPEIGTWLKDEHGHGHGHANALAAHTLHEDTGARGLSSAPATVAAGGAGPGPAPREAGRSTGSPSRTAGC